MTKQTILIVVIAFVLILVGIFSLKNTAPDPIVTTTPIPTPTITTSPSPEVTVSSPAANSIITSPLSVSGKALGNWFFEANIGVFVYDANGVELGRVGGQAQGEWMTPTAVPFTATVTFKKPTTATGTLVIKNDNPSDRRDLDKSFVVPIRFTVATATSSIKPTTSPLAQCRATGCSSHICSDKDVMSTCEFREAYACYKTTGAKCERQSSGSCGWTQTSELKSCLANAK